MSASSADDAQFKEHKKHNRIKINAFLLVSERLTLFVIISIKAREKEIESLEKTLAEGGHKRVFQRLPRHERRRQMSHNPHLVPNNLRTGAISEASVREFL